MSDNSCDLNARDPERLVGSVCLGGEDGDFIVGLQGLTAVDKPSWAKRNEWSGAPAPPVKTPETVAGRPLRALGGIDRVKTAKGLNRARAPLP